MKIINKQLLLTIILFFLPLLGIGCTKNNEWVAMYYSGGCKTCQEITITKDSIEDIEGCYNYALSLNENEKNNPALVAAVECGKNCKKDENFQYICTESVTKTILELLGNRGVTDIPNTITKEENNLDKTEKKNILENSSPTTREIIQQSSYSKDKNNIFYKDKKLESASINDFQVLEAGYAKDNRSVYHMGEPLPQFDAVSFYVFREQPQYVKDKNGVYQFGKLIRDSDPDSFVVLGSTIGDVYTKDKNYVYCLDTSKLEGADSTSFQQIPSTPYGKDVNHVFYDCKMIKDADPKTFRVVNYKYAADKDHVWEETYDAKLQQSSVSVIRNANPDTFDY